jgi:hypothetical protein
VIAFFLVLATAALPLAQTSATVNSDRTDTTFIPSVKPTLHIKPLAGAIEIDGNLDDSGWTCAARAANFTETFPGDQIKPPVDTQALVTYDQTHLYIAFIAQAEPSLIRSSLRARDEIFSDDYVGVILDTYDNDPRGLAMDVQRGGHRLRRSFRIERQDHRTRLPGRDGGAVQKLAFPQPGRTTLARHFPAHPPA